VTGESGAPPPSAGEHRRHGVARRASPVLIATAVAGGAGYVATLLASLRLGQGSFVSFAALWASVFFVAGTFGGWQVEITRASHRTSEPRSLRPVALTATLVGIGALGLAVAWTLGLSFVHAEPGLRGAPAVAIAGVGAVMLGTVAGMAAGAERWGTLAVMLSAEGVLRLLFVGAAVIAGAGFWVMSASIAVPAVVVSLVVLAFRRPLGLADIWVDGTPRELAQRALATIAASAALSAVISALPALMTMRSSSVPVSVVEGAQTVTQLLRAPMVVVALALQGFAVVTLRTSPQAVKRIPRVLVALVVLGGALGVLAALVVPGLVSAVYGDEKEISSLLSAALIGSAALLVGVFLVAIALLALMDHRGYAAVWGITAAVTIGAMLLPVGFDPRLTIALILAPACGMGYGVRRLLTHTIVTEP